jgi:hypothetical protein
VYLTGLLIGGVFVLWGNIFKAKVDDTGNAFKAWEAITRAQQTQIDSLTARLTAVENELSQVKKRHAEEITDLIAKHADEMRTIKDDALESVRARDAEIKGLRDSIIQNSRSTVTMIGRTRARAKAGEDRQAVAEARADGVDTRQTASDDRQNVNDERVLGMEDEINRIDQAGSNSKGRIDG